MKTLPLLQCVGNSRLLSGYPIKTVKIGISYFETIFISYLLHFLP